MRTILFFLILAVFSFITILSIEAKDSNEYRYVHEYDPTPKRLPPNLLKQLLDFVETKYGHLKNRKSKNGKSKIS